MASNFGEASTVVDFPPYSGKRPEEPFVKPNHATIEFPTPTISAADMAFTTTDYALHDRPFFVPIGKQGVIAALEKLDQQLQAVMHSHPSNACFISFFIRREEAGFFPRRSQRTGSEMKLLQVK